MSEKPVTYRKRPLLNTSLNFPYYFEWRKKRYEKIDARIDQLESQFTDLVLQKEELAEKIKNEPSWWKRFKLGLELDKIDVEINKSRSLRFGAYERKLYLARSEILEFNMHMEELREKYNLII